jgi:hypothetical protein
MGISGLLKALRSVTDDVDLREYENLTAAVDALCWLHKVMAFFPGQCD